MTARQIAKFGGAGALALVAMAFASQAQCSQCHALGLAVGKKRGARSWTMPNAGRYTPISPRT